MVTDAALRIAVVSLLEPLGLSCNGMVPERTANGLASALCLIGIASWL